jgi:hypothetical protein
MLLRHHGPSFPPQSGSSDLRGLPPAAAPWRYPCTTNSLHVKVPSRSASAADLSSPSVRPWAAPGSSSTSDAAAPRVGRRGLVRPDPRHPPGRPTHRARTGESDRLPPPPAAGPCLADDSRAPHRGPGHLGRTQGPRYPPASQPARHRARAPAQRLDRAAVVSPRCGHAKSTPARRPEPPTYSTRSISSGQSTQGQRPPLVHRGGPGRLRRGCLSAPGFFAQQGRSIPFNEA